MSEIPVEAIKKLRDMTNAGISECKKTLVETNGDVDKALQLLVEKGAVVHQKNEEHTATAKKIDYERYIRVPLKTEELFEIPQDILDNHMLYLASDINLFTKDTVVYLDDYVDVDDETDEEIYPAFAFTHDLQMSISGQLVCDVIYNTKHQLQNPTINDFITNLNYYIEKDNFFTF